MAFKIHGEVSLDGAMFKRGLHEIGGETTAFLKNFAIGAIGIASVEQAISKTVESAEELVNTSKNLSLTVEQLQVMRQAAKENGIEFQTMATALERFNAIRENILRGGKGSAEQMAAMQRLGVSREQLQSQNAGQTFMGQISETAQKSNAADIAKDLKDVFGRGGDALFGTLQTNFDELGEKMRSMGAIMDNTTAHELKQFKDEMDLIGKVAENTLAPMLVKLGGALYDAITALGAFGTAAGTYFTDLLHGNFKAAGEDAAEEAKKFMETRNEAWAAMVAKSNAPTSHEQAIIDDESKTKKAAVKKEREIKSDSLISVGNFLGAGRGQINDVAQQHLQVARQQLTEMQMTKVMLDSHLRELQIAITKKMNPEWEH